MTVEIQNWLDTFKAQAKKKKIKILFQKAEDLIMIYPKHRKDICASLGYESKNSKMIVCYLVNLKKMRYYMDEGFSPKEIRENPDLDIVKQKRPHVIINYLV